MILVKDKLTDESYNISRLYLVLNFAFMCLRFQEKC